jgi:4'-phosphopantetheinyl transferase
MWNVAPDRPALADDEVHVWRVTLDQSPPCVQLLRGTLSPDEIERADRFHFQRDREHFIVARGALRAILSRYLEIDSPDLRFRYTDYGKPYLANDTLDLDFRFNVSHSNSVGLVCITTGREIGADIEWIRDGISRERIAERFFSVSEVKALRELPQHLQDQAFFNCWTRKEAFVKAKGEGLSIPLDEFVVSLVPDEPAVLLSVSGLAEETLRWTFHQLSAGDGYVAVVAVEGGNSVQPQCWEWQPPYPGL